MRISVWSSDVCSSDLEQGRRLAGEGVEPELQDPGVLAGELDGSPEVIGDRLRAPGAPARSTGALVRSGSGGGRIHEGCIGAASIDLRRSPPRREKPTHQVTAWVIRARSSPTRSGGIGRASGREQV